MRSPTEIAAEFIERRDYDFAFELLLRTAEDLALSSQERADAWQMLGGLTQIDPAYGDGDESGLSYYQRALQVAPEHVWAAMGVVSIFGDRPYQHKNNAAFQKAYVIASRNWDQLDTAARQELNERKSLYDAGQ